MDSILLPPDLQQFAADAVASGAYRDTTDVVAAGVRLLKQQRAERDAFIQSLSDAEAESERDGWYSLEDVMRDAESAIVGDQTGE